MRLIWGPRNHHVGLVVWTFRVEGPGWARGPVGCSGACPRSKQLFYKQGKGG